MPQSIALVTVVVRDYDEAIVYYTRTLGFQLLEDTRRTAPASAVAPTDGARHLRHARVCQVPATDAGE